MADILERETYISCFSDFLRRFREFHEIGKAVDKLIGDFDEKMQTALDNAFIEDCDKDALAYYEKLLGIKGTSGENIEDRKARVLSRWNNRTPCTYRTLKQRLDTLCGESNYMLEVNRYKVTCMLYDPSYVDEVETMMKTLLPVNLYIDVHYTAGNHAYEHHVAYTTEGELMTVKEMIE